MPTAAGSNVFQGAIVAKNLTDFFGFGFTALTPGNPTGPAIVRVAASPNGILSARVGSIALSQEAGGALYINTDGATAWTQVTIP